MSFMLCIHLTNYNLSSEYPNENKGNTILGNLHDYVSDILNIFLYLVFRDMTYKKEMQKLLIISTWPYIFHNIIV